MGISWALPTLVSVLESGSRVSGVSPLVTGVIVHLPFGSTILQLRIYVYRWPVPPDPFRRWLRPISLTICSCHQQVHATLPDQNQHPSNNFWLVVYLPLRKIYEFVSWDDDIPN